MLEVTICAKKRQNSFLCASDAKGSPINGLLPKLLRPFRADFATVHLPKALPWAFYVLPLRGIFIKNGPERTELFEPRATPWDIDPEECSPVRATQRNDMLPTVWATTR